MARDGAGVAPAIVLIVQHEEQLVVHARVATNLARERFVADRLGDDVLARQGMQRHAELAGKGDDIDHHVIGKLLKVDRHAVEAVRRDNPQELTHRPVAQRRRT